ncbi:MAG: hypothetical protein ACOY3Z_09870 [Thermodesulfobacteriota bacterium]
MKKVLSTVAAFGLIAGLATTASAVEFKMSGSYVVEGYYLSNPTYLGNDSSDALYQHTFKVLPVMKVNDKISMFGDIRLADDTMWGNTTDTVTTDGGNVDIHKLYMEYASPIGKWRMGRVSTGMWEGNFLNGDDHGNRIMWWPSFLSKPWSAVLFTQKITENEYGVVADDQDIDMYEIGIAHTTDAGKTSIKWDQYSNGSLDTDYYVIQAFAKYGFGNWGFEAEYGHKGGEATTTRDFDANAFMLNLTAKADALSGGVMYFFASGDDDTTAGDAENYMSTASMLTGGTGDQFQPLYIMTGYMAGMLNPHCGTNTSMADDGVHAVLLHGDYKVSDKFSVHAALGYGQADEETAGYEDDYGWEFNLGGAYKLLDNLTYEAHFGYLDAGDYFQYGVNTADVDNVTLLSHHLTMTF